MQYLFVEKPKMPRKSIKCYQFMENHSETSYVSHNADLLYLYDKYNPFPAVSENFFKKILE